MSNPALKFFVPVLAGAVLVSGCATTRPRKAAQEDLPSQVQALQTEVRAKDQQIQDLQYQLDSQQQSLSGGSSFSSSGGRSKLIRVSGVSVTDVQKALSRAGFDPGPVDGRMGKKTKSAIKQFQKRSNLQADGVVGEKTWSLLR